MATPMRAETGLNLEHKRVKKNKWFAKIPGLVPFSNDIRTLFYEFDSSSEKILERGPFRNIRQHLTHQDIHNIESIVGPDAAKFMTYSLEMMRMDKKNVNAFKILFEMGSLLFLGTPLGFGISMATPQTVDYLYGNSNSDLHQSDLKHNTVHVRHRIISQYRDDLAMLTKGEAEAIENMENIVSKSETLPNIPVLLNIMTGLAALAVGLHNPALGGAFAAMGIIANIYYLDAMNKMIVWKKKYGSHESRLEKRLGSALIAGTHMPDNPVTAAGLSAGQEWQRLIPKVLLQNLVISILPTIIGFLSTGNYVDTAYIFGNLFGTLQVALGNVDLTDSADAMVDMHNLSAALAKLAALSTSLVPEHKLKGHLTKQLFLPPLENQFKGTDLGTVSYPPFHIKSFLAGKGFEFKSPEILNLQPGGYLVDGKERSGRSMALRVLTYNIEPQQDQSTLFYDNRNRPHRISELTPSQFRKKFQYINKNSDEDSEPAYHLFTADSLFPIPVSASDPTFKLLSKYHKGERLLPEEEAFLEYARELILGETNMQTLLRITDNDKEYVNLIKKLAETSPKISLKNILLDNIRLYHRLFDQQDVNEALEEKPFTELKPRLKAKLLLIHSLNNPTDRKVIAFDGLLDELNDEDLTQAIIYMKSDIEKSHTTFIFHTNEEHVKKLLMESGLINSKIVCEPEVNGQVKIHKE